jgi:RNA polymerase sigma-70 factor (ECF subfamily)
MSETGVLLHRHPQYAPPVGRCSLAESVRLPDPKPKGRETHEPPEIRGLLAAACRGEEAAWRQVLELYGRRVYALAKSRCQKADLAEEITQSVFATVAAKLGSGGYAEEGKFEAWLFRITMNRIRDEMRRSKHRPEATDPGVLGGLAGPGREGRPEEEAESDKGVMMGRLRDAMGRLSESDREVIELRHHGGMSFKQMSELLDEPLGTLLARHHRALRKLKQLIEAGAGETGHTEGLKASGVDHDDE